MSRGAWFRSGHWASHPGPVRPARAHLRKRRWVGIDWPQRVEKRPPEPPDGRTPAARAWLPDLLWVHLVDRVYELDVVARANRLAVAGSSG
jgi:hypothetical protein